MKVFIKYLTRTIIVAILCLVVSPLTNAQSTVYIFSHETVNSEVPVTKNGEFLFDMRGPLKKSKESSAFVIPLNTYSESFRKCTFNDEGKVVIGFQYKYTNPVNAEVITYADEIQINLSTGSVHYLFITRKGFNNAQIKEISEKEANKKMKDKKIVELPEYSE